MMKMNNGKIIGFIICSLCLKNVDCGKVLMCHVLNWSVYRTGEGSFDISKIDPYLCTHIVYGFRALNDTTWRLQVRDAWADYEGKGNMPKLLGLKKENPDLKILLSVGGWSEGSIKFSDMVSKPESRQAFITDVIQHLQNDKVDGLEIDWNHPTMRGGKPEDKQNFVILLQELRRAMDEKNFILSVRLTGTRFVASGYDLSGISQAVHFINLKAYSYEGTWNNRTGVYSALDADTEHNVRFSIDFFLDEGVDRDKLLLGVTTEGNAFLMDNPPITDKYLDQPAHGEFSGPWLNEAGYFGFNELCWELTKTNLWREFWDEASSTPYAVSGNKFVSYDNVRSLQLKVKLVGEKKLAGASMYSLDSDDFRGLCYDQPFILTNAVKDSMTTKQLSFEFSIVNQEFP